MSVLAIDIGGTNIKSLATGQNDPRKCSSGEKMTPEQMVAGVKRLAGDGAGGGNAKKLINLAAGCRVGSNSNALVGGFRMWNEEGRRRAAARARNAAAKMEARKA
jgi:hypothetical protein